MNKLHFDSSSLSQQLSSALNVLKIQEIGKDIPVDLIKFTNTCKYYNGYNIHKDQNSIVVEYSNISSGLRAIGSLLTGLPDGNTSYSEDSHLKTIGFLLDCSRNAVLKPEFVKLWLNKLALLGFNMGMLYTEDIFELEDEEYFGYCRGRYSSQELRDIASHAAKLGIEMAGCIQTLGHLGQVLKWSVYNDIKDTANVLLVGNEKTYEFIEKMIKFYSDVFPSRRIFVGMDEAHDLGRGQYRDKFGNREPFQLFNEHLDRVAAICKKYDLKPIIASDMYFRMGSKSNSYYDRESVIPEAVKTKIPSDVDLAYWDYYHTDEEFYIDWIERHRELGIEPMMFSGIYTWDCFWYDSRKTLPTIKAAVNATRTAKIKDVVFCLFRDDGAYCDFNSALSGLTHAAELCYQKTNIPSILARRFATVCGGDVETNNYIEQSLNFSTFLFPEIPWDVFSLSVGLLWDDPLLGIFWHNEKLRNPQIWELAYSQYDNLSKFLAGKTVLPDSGCGNIKQALLIAEVLKCKILLQAKLERSYTDKDFAGLSGLLKDIPVIVQLLRELDSSFRNEWLKQNKAFGLEVVQIRMAGRIRRFDELAHRIQEFIDGKVDRIEELENRPHSPFAIHTSHYYNKLASGSIIQ